MPVLFGPSSKQLDALGKQPPSAGARAERARANEASKTHNGVVSAERAVAAFPLPPWLPATKLVNSADRRPVSHRRPLGRSFR